MESGPYKTMINMSSDHGGIAVELARLEREMYRVIAHVEDARKLRNYLVHMRAESAKYCAVMGFDMRGWMERTRKTAG